MSRKLRFETPDELALSFETAGPGSRAAAALLDVAFMGLAVAAALGALVATDVVEISFRDLARGGAGFGLSMLVAGAFGLNILYFLVAERLLDGQSPGKRIVGLRVVLDGGFALSLGASAIRNVARVVDMLPGPYLVGLVALLLSTRHKRLGDYLAGTLVVRQRRAARPDRHFPGQRYSTRPDKRFALGPERLAKLSPETLGLLDEYFERRGALPAEAAARLTERLARSLARPLALSVAPADQEALLVECYLALRERAEAAR